MSVIFFLQILVKTCLNVMFITFRREKNKFLRIQDYCVVFAPCWLKSLFCYYYKVVFKLFISNVKLHPIDLTSITHALNTLVNILNEIKLTNLHLDYVINRIYCLSRSKYCCNFFFQNHFLSNI